MSDASIALNRFGLGARPDEAVPDAPRRWLLDQFARWQPRPGSLATVPTSGAIAGDFARYLAQVRSLRQAKTAPSGGMASADTDAVTEARQIARRDAQGHYAAAFAARATAALLTPAPFVERLAHFWAKHFAVSADELDMIGLAGTLECEAIRPHVLGRFVDMLSAVERHPAMLLYLDQAPSVGPNSPVGTRQLTSDLTADDGRNAAATGTLAARLIAPENGARIAMIETGGWDTHAQQRGRLATQLKGGDALIAALQVGLGPLWSDTLVLVAAEFGRTVRTLSALFPPSMGQRPSAGLIRT